MSTEKRKQDYKFNRSFYILALLIFSSMAVLSFLICIIDKFTDERVVIIIMNAWFTLFTMDIVNVRFKRKGESFFWSNWTVFTKKQQSRQRNPQEIRVNLDNQENKEQIFIDNIKKAN